MRNIVKFASLAIIVVALSTCSQTWKSGSVTVMLSGGTLTVTGNGAMEDYGIEGVDWMENLPPPWSDLNSSIKSIIIGDSVTSIGEWAFAGCKNLTSVSIGNSVKSIGDMAFAGCIGLTSITIPNSITIIGGGVLGRAFSDCYGLKSITIPSSVTNIGKIEFYACSSLTSINVALDNPNYSSEDGVLFNKNKTKLIKFPEGKKGAYIIPKTVTKLGKYAFRECYGMTSLTILTSVPPSRDSETFYYQLPNKAPCLYVPKGSIDAYRNAEGWNWKCLKEIEPMPIRKGN